MIRHHRGVLWKKMPNPIWIVNTKPDGWAEANPILITTNVKAAVAWIKAYSKTWSGLLFPVGLAWPNFWPQNWPGLKYLPGLKFWPGNKFLPGLKFGFYQHFWPQFFLMYSLHNWWFYWIFNDLYSMYIELVALVSYIDSLLKLIVALPLKICTVYW